MVASGTVSGPTLITLADTAMYMALLGEIGLVALAVGEVFIYSAGQADPVAHATVTHAIPQETD